MRKRQRDGTSKKEKNEVKKRKRSQMEEVMI
jgi:hypothetical protein